MGGPVWWKCEINNSDGSLNDKNVIVKIYDKNADINNPNSNPITSFDPFYESINNAGAFGWFQSGSFTSQTQGIYGQIVYDIKNQADLNRDGRVSLSDFAILGNEWMKDNISNPNRFGSYVGKDVNDLGAYADIDRSGAVDFNDLGIYCSEYLWDADDSNTW